MMTQLGVWMLCSNKLLKYTPTAKGAASAGQPTLRFGCPLARHYAH